MRVWIDITNSPHVVIFRPLIARLRARGCEVTVTAREFAQTIGLLERFGIEHVSVGAHGGGSSAGKARAMAGRSAALVRFARRERFDLAVAHGSTDQPLAARAAGTPQVTMFDYEYATVMHHWNGRLATRVLVPSAIPEEALARYGMRPPKLVRYPGLKEEYYLADHAIDDGVLAELGLDPGRLIAVMRPPPEVTLYHRGASTDLFAAHAGAPARGPGGADRGAAAHRRAARRARGRRGDRARARRSTGPRLVAAADLVVSAGGTMNREAAALGVPAYTPFAARLGAVDRSLIAEGRLRRLEDPADVLLERRPRDAPPPLRDPEVLLDLILGAARSTLPPL